MLWLTRSLLDVKDLELVDRLSNGNVDLTYGRFVVHSGTVTTLS